MNIEYVGRNYDVDDSIRDFTEDKLDKVLKFVEEPVDVHLSLEVEKHRHIADLQIHHRFGSIRATESTGQMLEAINLAIDKVEKQARRAREKFMDQRRRAGNHDHQWPLDVVERQSVGEGRQPRIVKSSRLQIKPMTIEEAALQLETSKNEFIVFRDAETDRTNVLYNRRDGNFGLIVPE